MLWIFHTEKRGREILVFIGAVQIANIHLHKVGGDWHAYLTYMNSSSIKCNNVKDALTRIKDKLNSPPVEEVQHD